MPWLAAAAVAGPIIGGLIGSASASKDRDQQKKMMKAALSELEKVGMPPDLSKRLILQEFQSAGMYTPQLEEDLNSSVAESEIAKIQEDPALRDAQTQALQMLQQRAKVGLSAEDRAALNQVRQQVQTDSQAKQGQLLQEMQSRGMGGSGAEMIARLQSAQSEADRASTQSDTTMAQAQERALQALGQSGQMAGQVRGQDFDVANTKAAALDERNRFLADNSIARQGRNVGALNEAQQQNLANKQSILSANTAQANAETQRQNQATGDYWQNKLNYGQAKANAMVGQATQAGQQAQRTADMYSGIGSAVGTGIGGYAQMKNANEQNQLNRDAKFSDEDLKESVDYTDDSVQKWLDGLSTKILRKKS